MENNPYNAVVLFVGGLVTGVLMTLIVKAAVDEDDADTRHKQWMEANAQDTVVLFLESPRQKKAA